MPEIKVKSKAGTVCGFCDPKFQNVADEFIKSLKIVGRLVHQFLLTSKVRRCWIYGVAIETLLLKRLFGTQVLEMDIT